MSLQHEYRIISLKEVDSTNSWAKLAFAEKIIYGGAAIVAETQNAGRGQMRTKWHDEAGKNLLLTLLIEPERLPISAFFKLNQVASLALADVLGKYFQTQIKWPNDILVKNKKIAGILIETSIQSNLIKSAFIGIGLNVNQHSFPPDLNATSVGLEISKEIDLGVLLAEILNALSFRISQLQVPNRLENDYYNNLKGTNERLKYADKNGIFYAKLLKVEADGRLVLEVENEATFRYYRFKEVQLLA